MAIQFVYDQVAQTAGGNPIVVESMYQTIPDINGGPNARSMNPIDLTATFPGIVQTANGEYTGQNAATNEPMGEMVHFGANGWMVGQAGCVRDGAEIQNGGSGVDMPDVSWCGLNNWIGSHPLLAVAGLALLFYGTRAGAARVRARRTR